MARDAFQRRLLIRSRLADGYQLSEAALKDLQHALTDLFPRAAYADLTADVVSVDVTVRRDFTTEKDVFSASFRKADGTVIKAAQYFQDMLGHKACPDYKSVYDGKKDGFDHRLVFYSTESR